MIREGAEGVISRGKAEPGDKTMCDVWLPVAESLEQAIAQNLSIPAALEAASRGGKGSSVDHHHAGP